MLCSSVFDSTTKTINKLISLLFLLIRDFFLEKKNGKTFLLSLYWFTFNYGHNALQKLLYTELYGSLFHADVAVADVVVVVFVIALQCKRAKQSAKELPRMSKVTK